MSLFSEGGPLNTRHRVGHQYDMTVSIPKDHDGLTARECPEAACSPGFYKVKGGTGLRGQPPTNRCLRRQCNKERRVLRKLPEDRQAVREILRVKTDREIAQLPRQSYRVLNLHERKQSNIYHREPWTDYELKLPGEDA